MESKWEQMELDTRDELNRALDLLTEETVGAAQELIARCREAPPMVRNRHEAYGHAAEWLGKSAHAVGMVKKDVSELLLNLGRPEQSPMEAVSSIVNSFMDAAGVLNRAAAEMKRVMSDLYASEELEPERTPMDDYMDGGADFQEAGERPEDAQENPADNGDEESEE